MCSRLGKIDSMQTTKRKAETTLRCDSHAPTERPIKKLLSSRIRQTDLQVSVTSFCSLGDKKFSLQILLFAMKTSLTTTLENPKVPQFVQIIKEGLFERNPSL